MSERDKLTSFPQFSLEFLIVMSSLFKDNKANKRLLIFPLRQLGLLWLTILKNLTDQEVTFV